MNDFFEKNGKKFVLQLVGIVCLTALTITGHVEASVTVPIISIVIGVNAGAVTRS